MSDENIPVPVHQADLRADPRYDPIIDKAAARHGVDATLVRAVIQVESAYQRRARSPKGAMGLMQLMPATARQYGVADPYDPASNIEAGTRHLRSLLERLPLTLASRRTTPEKRRSSGSAPCRRIPRPASMSPAFSSSQAGKDPQTGALLPDGLRP